MRNLFFLLSRNITITCILLSLAQLKCTCENLLARNVGSKDNIEEQKKHYQVVADSYQADLKARNEALSQWMAEKSRLDAIESQQEKEASEKCMEMFDHYASKIKVRELEPHEYNFVPSVRADNIEQLEIYLSYLKEMLEEEGATGPFSGEVKQKSQETLDDILQEHRQIKVIYRHLKRKLKDATCQELKSIQQDIQLAKKFLEDINQIKLAFNDLLASKNESLSNYGYDGYESDPDDGHESNPI